MSRRNGLLLLIGAAVVCAALALPRAAGSDVDRYRLNRGLAEEKDQLGTIALVGDVLLIEDVAGEPDKVYVGECRRQGDWLLQELVRKLTGRHYRVEARPLLSVGMVAAPDLSLAMLQNWDQHHDKVESFPVEKAPFYVAPILLQDPGTADAWRDLVRRVWRQAESDGWSGDPVVPVDSTLRATLGADDLLAVVGWGVQVPFGKGLAVSMVTDGTKTAEGPCSTDYMVFSHFQMSQVEGWKLSLALLDARTGRLIWSNSVCDGTISIHGKPSWNLRYFAVKEMP